MSTFFKFYLMFKRRLKMFLVVMMSAALGTLVQISYSSLKWSQNNSDFKSPSIRSDLLEHTTFDTVHSNKTLAPLRKMHRVDDNSTEEFVAKVVREGPNFRFGFLDGEFPPLSSKPNRNVRRYYFPMLNPLKLYPVLNMSLERMPKIVLVTYFRSGSSFLGDLLQQSPRTFYTFEPLHYMTDGLRIGQNMVPEALDLLHSILKCEFNKIPHYVAWGMKPENRFLFKWNTFLWHFCKFRPHLCLNPTFVHDACIRSTQHVVKLTRLHMRDVEKLMRSIDGNNLKIVYLLRDPRGIYSSRKAMSWCNNTLCSDIRTLCNEMSDDFRIFLKLKREQPNNVFLIRYEELSLNPAYEAQVLFSRLNISYSYRIQRYLASHTAASKSNELSDPYSTKRDSQAMPLQWMQKLTPSEIDKVQNECKDLRKFGYKVWDTETDLKLQDIMSTT